MPHKSPRIILQTTHRMRKEMVDRRNDRADGLGNCRNANRQVDRRRLFHQLILHAIARLKKQKFVSVSR
jgi:hypothetical protein